MLRQRLIWQKINRKFQLHDIMAKYDELSALKLSKQQDKLSFNYLAK